ncbi:hypothetical protein SAMN05421863_106710 [Nitrosomonas communis]|uniref:Uncharacterized protein n=1 Tax=Nitrosomonas communis TaxID=44574 RepID=A0A1I4UMD9_9PROT|nr:hypothetical protein SAMN05421863_106710 [Nitrosomonas communis]
MGVKITVGNVEGSFCVTRVDASLIWEVRWWPEYLWQLLFKQASSNKACSWLPSSART